ncbi:MarR family winged helix-turn-helix transcriptional regulator [Exiguobacterium profundum]|uniref:Transcriptional regulator, MarR family n=1 Tax=Exiguobacterium sp. (strain ATCC BAA-1283 / AT1b) TaxID=360911 RepID=C4L1E2_EXISA|nr:MULTISPECIES: MarR family transcriptional regulator [Exiguobacterium]MCC9623815.1 MarR family transcriptional regulator [Thalassospira sp. MA62]QPI66442.1 MarR family transcriptional regulator [Exiguobacterium sp. PBE]ACQ69088.1 transcriptional regulator, MarR family [Exiguobacterium sp. AT1b]MBG0916935.1 MarR family transcriptional regulator [Exiguobacterium sp. SRB7LM]MCT4799085.1 MarR family transcriptional regulator [Exiguobacterium profundum]
MPKQDAADQFVKLIPLIRRKLLRRSDFPQIPNLNFSHFHLLMLIEDEGAVTNGRISETLSIAPPNVTPLITKLLNEGYITRVPDERDRRVIWNQLTEKGERILLERRDSFRRLFEERLAFLNEDETDRLIESLKTLTEIVEKMDKGDE